MKRAERLLLICYFDPQGIETVLDNIGDLKAHSNFSIDVLNLFGAPSALTRGEGYSLADYDGVVIHNTLSYNPANLESLDRQLDPPLRHFDGVKVILKQDEQYRTLAVADFIGTRGFDLVLTCVCEREREKVYPRAVVGDDVAFMQMYTGYVTPKLLARTSTDAARTIDISYRGSLQPLYFGRLAYDKRQIGDDVLRAAEGKGLTLDISSRWEDRLMGEDWFRFLAQSKSTLGVESGASIFDFDGSVERTVKALEPRRNEFANEHEYSEWVLKQIEPHEGNVYYNQISPRHFEAGAARTLQVMHEGEYSGIFLPWRHFAPLQKDLGNFDVVLEHVLDPALRGEMTERVYEEIIRNPIYSMRHFVQQLDERIADLIDRKPRKQSPTHRAGGTPRRNALLLCAHPPQADPRIAWVADHAPDALRIHTIGIGSPSTGQRVTGALDIVVPKLDSRQWQRLALTGRVQSAGLDVLCQLQVLAQAGTAELDALVGGGVTEARAHAFNWNCRHLMHASETLIQAGQAAAGHGAIIAADFDALIAAVVLKDLYPGTAVLYDAHEFWSTSHGPDTAPWEIDIWQRLERTLLAHVDSAVTVSPQLAAHLTSYYGRPFLTAPNCEPLQAGTFQDRAGERRQDRCVFLFQGNFMPGRGLELLIDAWADTDPAAILELRGPDRPYKTQLEQRASRTGLLGKRIFFPAAVPESELVAAASAADVGLVPYEPTTLNSRYSSPNKVSQYMAARLPILANRLDFVRQTVDRARCAEVVDFTQRAALVAAIDKLARNPAERALLGQRGREEFEARYHWEAQGQALYQALAGLLEQHPPAPFAYNPGPVASQPPQTLKRRLTQRLGALWHRLPAPAQNALRPLLSKVAARLVR